MAILIAVLPVLAGMGFYIWQQYQDLVDDSITDAINIVKSTADYDSNLLEHTAETLLNMSYMPLMRTEDWDSCHNYLHHIHTDRQKFISIGVIDLEGRLACSSHDSSENLGAYLGDREYYNNALTNIGLTFIGYIYGRFSSVPTAVLAVRVPSEYGNTIGVAYVTFNLESLHVDNYQSKIQPYSKIWIMDKNMVVLHSAPAGINIPGDRLQIEHDWSSDMDHIHYTDANGKKWHSFMLATGDSVAPTTLYIRYDVPDAVIYASAKQYLWFGLGSLALLLLLTILFALVLVRVAAGRSLALLRNTVVRLASGDFDARVAAGLQGKELQEIGTQLDVMAQTIQDSARSLKQSEYGYRMLFENSPNPMVVMDLSSGKILAANNEALRIYGYSKKEFLSLSLDDLREEVLYNQPDTVYSNEVHLRKDGASLFVEVRSLSLLFIGKSAHVLLIRDLTEREALNRNLQERETLISHLLDVTAEAIYGLDADGCCIFANKACAKLLGYDHPQQLIGKHFHYLIHYKHADGSPYPLEECVMHLNLKQGMGSHVDDEVLWRRDGTCFPVEYWSYPILKNGELDFCLVTFLDITERRSQQEALSYQAKHDALTGLFNRSELNSILANKIAAQPQGPLVLVSGNLDNFKEINEALGHDVGDLLLECLADRLRQVLKPDSYLARVGGDEFSFLLQGYDLLEAHYEVESLAELVKEPFMLEGLRLRASMSFGIAQLPLHADNAIDLIRMSDTAMRKAKKDSLGLAIYNRSYSDGVEQRLFLRGELITAVENQQFVMHLQPKLALASKTFTKGHVIGFEALVRWHHPSKGLISPAVFIPIIEASGLIHEFTSIVLNQSVSYCAQLQQQYPGIRVSVNVSVKNILEAGFVNQVKTVLEKYRLDPILLELEVTESSLMVDPKRSLYTMQALHDLGILLSIDDFGTGYSSFAYLNKYPIDILKIDQSFVYGMDEDKNKATIVKSIIDMAHTLNIKVIAEGIETAAVLRDLYIMGCDAGQGYYIGKPVNLVDTYRWLAAEKDFFGNN